MAKLCFAISIVLLSVGAVGQLPQVSWQTSLGNINHIQGPSDQPLNVVTLGGQDMVFTPNSSGKIRLSGPFTWGISSSPSNLPVI
jgi:hypothetical protein